MASHVAHDMAIVALPVVLTYDGIPVAVARFYARGVRLLTHQGTHHDSRTVPEVYLAVLHITVAQTALATHPAGKGPHAGGIALSREGTAFDAQALHRAEDIVEQTHPLALVVAHSDVLDDMASAVVVAFKAPGSGSDGVHQRVLHVDVGSLADIEIAPLHRADGNDELC